MRRIGLAVVLTLSLFAAPRAAHAQQVGKVSRIGYLALGLRPVPGSDPTFDAFLQGLRELGHVEGRSVALEIRYAEGRNERFPTLAAELVNLKVDVLIAESTPAAIAPKQASSTVPVVMVSVGDPVGAKLIDSLAHPGGNLTGLSLVAPEL
jgi:putative tryptophan/tyrosine transport system substrate-binding protein